MKFTYLYRGKPTSVEVQSSGNAYQVSVGGKAYSVKLLNNTQGNVQFEIDVQPLLAESAKQGRKVWLHLGGRNYELEKAAGSRAAGLTQGDEVNLRAPMPGQVRKVYVQAGESVKAGTVLLLLEAMKMEIRIQAAREAKVARIAVEDGQSVEKDQLLVELEAGSGG